MIDFHSHILPDVDDGAIDEYESIALLREQLRQGVDRVFLTPHFYASDDSPESFLYRRDAAYRRLISAVNSDPALKAEIPKLYLGAEVYYFPGISDCEQIGQLSLGNTGCVLIEPPMRPWSQSMLDEIEAIGSNSSVVPVIAHVDRYCRKFKDDTLFDRLSDRKILTQVNASFFIHEDKKSLAMSLLEAGRIHMLGTDCHDCEIRKPNLAAARRSAVEAGCGKAFEAAVRNMYRLIKD